MEPEQANTHPLSTDHFRAFVSYSHVDAKAARKLHRKIENYRLPLRLRNILSNTLPGRSDGRMGKVFRDREDLPAAQDLSQSVKAALQTSEALIVLCSPDAKNSPWVAREITLFRSLHPDRPILAAIIRGEPEDAFPVPLTQGNEPLAADLRKEGDGWRLGFLKIIAGIASLPLDALVQRDTQRQLRSVMAITGSALAAMVIMGAMTIFSLQQRNEAQHQRAEAEGLIEYMLTDLRDELKGSIGKLAVMQRVNKRALEYYERQGRLSSFSPVNLERRARVIGAMGIDANDQGRYDLGRKWIEEWHRTTKAILQKEPENPDRIFSHAQSENRLALLDYRNGNREAALSGFLRAKRTLDRIPAAELKNPTWLKLSALISGNLCASTMRLENLDNFKIQYCLKAVSESQKIIDISPQKNEYQYDLIFHLTWLGEGYARINNQVLAKKHWEDAAKRVEELVTVNPENILFREQKMEIYAYLAEVSPSEKKQLIDVALTIANELIFIDPDSQTLKKKREKYLNKKGEL